MANEAPISKTYYQLSFGTVTVATWPDGHKSAQFQVDQRLRDGPSDLSANASQDQRDRHSRQKEKSDLFKERGQFDAYDGDAMNLVSVGRALLPASADINIRI